MLANCHHFIFALTIQIAESSTCLGINLVNKLLWFMIFFNVKKIMNKVGALKRMKYLPVKTLAEIHFETIIRSVTYRILTCGKCSTALLSRWDTVHSRTPKIIYNLHSSLSDTECLLTSSWPPISYSYKKYVFLFLHKVCFDSVLFACRSIFCIWQIAT